MIYLILGIFLVLVLAALFPRTFVMIKPYEEGIYMFMGNYKRILRQGPHLVMPFARQVIIVDERVQTLDVPRQEVITKDNSPTNVDAVIYTKVVDPKKAVFEVQNYREATVFLAQTNLRSVIGDMELDEILTNRHVINARLRNDLDKATDPWGVRVEAVEIKEVDPVDRVKKAMEEQTSAERERRAAILRADGKKRAAILEAEGAKLSNILNAEGVKQSKILTAEGERTSLILRAQGDAQKLRILSLGAASLDHRALTVLSLEALGNMAKGQATKIIFPFEISRLVEGAAEYLGVTSKQETRDATTTFEELTKMVGDADTVIGEIPKIEEIEAEMKENKDEVGAILKDGESTGREPVMKKTE